MAQITLTLPDGNALSTGRQVSLRGDVRERHLQIAWQKSDQRHRWTVRILILRLADQHRCRHRDPHHG